MNEFLKYTKRERSAILILSLVLFLFFTTDIFFHRLHPPENFDIPSDSLVFYSKLLEELEKENERDKGGNVYSIDPKKGVAKSMSKVNYQLFDPNELEIKGWVDLGFSDKQAGSIVKYRNSMGSFKRKEDLKACFVIDEKKYNELEPYIRFEFNTSGIKIERESVKSKEANNSEGIIQIELNSADSAMLLDLKGVGPFYASKIISYRNQLGGFYSINQLLELWKFDSLKLKGIKAHVYIDTSFISLLKINSDSIAQLYHHPYIDYNTARAIVAYREQHGYFKKPVDLKNIVLIDDSLFGKLRSYISIE